MQKLLGHRSISHTATHMMSFPRSERRKHTTAALWNNVCGDVLPSEKAEGDEEMGKEEQEEEGEEALLGGERGCGGGGQPSRCCSNDHHRHSDGTGPETAAKHPELVQALLVEVEEVMELAFVEEDFISPPLWPRPRFASGSWLSSTARWGRKARAH